MGRIARLPVPRHELVEAFGGMIGEALQNVGEPGSRIDIVEFCRLCRPRHKAVSISEARQAQFAPRSPKRPRISSPFSALCDEGVDRRCAGSGARRLAAEQCPRRPGPARTHKPIAQEPRQPSVLPSF